MADHSPIDPNLGSFSSQKQIGTCAVDQCRFSRELFRVAFSWAGWSGNPRGRRAAWRQMEAGGASSNDLLVMSVALTVCVHRCCGFGATIQIIMARPVSHTTLNPPSLRGRSVGHAGSLGNGRAESGIFGRRYE